MIKFCEKVLKFLQCEYLDNYKFEVEVCKSIKVPTKSMSLKITIMPGYVVKITDDYMKYLFEVYLENKLVPETNQYLWQKELLNIIEDNY